VNFLITILSFVILSGCGVKGRPQPPELPAVMSRGEPNFFRTTEAIKLRTEKSKKIPGDFEEKDDFDESDERKK
jgi:hypothetical protein